MTFLSGRKPALPAFVFVVILCGLAFTQDLKVLDHSAYDIWNLIKEEKISANGEWVGYVQGPENGDSRVLVKNRFLDQTFAGGRGRDVAFSYDNQYCLFTIPPTKALLREKKLAKVKKKDLPGDSLGIIQLKTGEKTVIPGIADFVLPPKGLGVVAYTLREQPEDTTLSDSVRAVIKEKTRKGVKTLVIRNLGSGGEQTLKDVREFAFSEDGRWLAYVLATPDSSGDGLFLNFVGTG
ncbi:MAG TPA: hypothetical protein PLG66_21490, partial [Calditrichia bacterium]|nr:hypothetical protein [Calditrichia bacterium]